MIFGIILIAAAFLVYLFALHGEFVFDDMTLLNNVQVMSGNWRETLNTRWRQLPNILFALEVKYFGRLQTASFHAFSVLLHGLNGCLVMALAQALGMDSVLSFLCGLIFTVHPLGTGAVAYISARSSVLGATWSLCAMVLTLSGHPILGLPFIPLALFSKEDTAILPVTLAAVLLVRGETWGVAYLAVPLVVLVSRWKAIRIDLTQTGDDGMTAAGFAGAIPQPHYSLTTFVEMMLRYPAWMVGLRNNIDPDIQKIRWDDQRLIVALLVVAAGLEAFWMFPALRMSFVLMAVSPWLLYIFFPMPDPIMEHRAYLSIAGIAVFFVEILKNAPVWLLTLGIAYLAMSCCARAYYWRSSIDLWSAAMRAGSHKKPRVLVNLGAAWQIKGDFRTASEFYDKTLAINPNCAPALVNLAYIAMRDQRIPIAVQWLKTCIERCPRYPLAWNALGQLYRQMNQLEEADRCLKQSEFLMAGG